MMSELFLANFNIVYNFVLQKCHESAPGSANANSVVLQCEFKLQNEMKMIKMYYNSKQPWLMLFEIMPDITFIPIDKKKNIEGRLVLNKHIHSYLYTDILTEIKQKKETEDTIVRIINHLSMSDCNAQFVEVLCELCVGSKKYGNFVRFVKKKPDLFVILNYEKIKQNKQLFSIVQKSEKFNNPRVKMIVLKNV